MVRSGRTSKASCGFRFVKHDHVRRPRWKHDIIAVVHAVFIAAGHFQDKRNVAFDRLLDLASYHFRIDHRKLSSTQSTVATTPQLLSLSLRAGFQSDSRWNATSLGAVVPRLRDEGAGRVDFRSSCRAGTSLPHALQLKL
jgi:hypothetical protein